MPHRQLDLIYAKSDSLFFANMAKMRSDITAKKKQKETFAFTEKDEEEIGRGQRYAVFDALKKNKLLRISTAGIRACLNDKNVTQIAFQNKILNMILQTKLGLAFPFTAAIHQLLLAENKGLNIVINQNKTGMELKVEDTQHVTLIVKLVCTDMFDTDRPEDIFEASIKINISLETVELGNCHLTQLSDSHIATILYHHLEENQQNFLMKLITFIMRLLGFNDELVLEKTDPAEGTWEPVSPGNLAP